MSEWKESKLEDVTVFIKDGTHGTHKDFTNGIPLLSAKDIENGKILIPVDSRTISEIEYNQIHANYEIENDDLLLTIVGTIGRVAIAKKLKKKITFQRSVGIIRMNKNKIFPDYSFHFFHSNEFQKTLERSKNASAQGGVYLGELNKLKLLHPVSLYEQRKISHILSTADAVIEKTQAAIAKYKAIKQGMLHDLFTRGIDIKTGKLRPRYEDAPQLYKLSSLGFIPREWEVNKLGEYSFITKLAGFEYTLYFDYSKSGPIIAVRALNIKQGKLSLENVHTIPKETNDILPRSQLQKGDLVISYVGTVGEVAVIPENNKFHLAPNVAKISVEKKEVDPFYLNQFLNADVGQHEIIKLVSSTTQAALSMQNLREVKFIKPKIEEQKLIEKMLNNIDTSIETEQTYLQKIQSIKQGLMNDLLSGKKKVSEPLIEVD